MAAFLNAWAGGVTEDEALAQAVAAGTAAARQHAIGVFDVAEAADLRGQVLVHSWPAGAAPHPREDAAPQPAAHVLP